ncbi:restriction endonuclease subunit S [Streptomyces sp. NPDC058297]|uniref:restriction endonuclease subunit S n=1 Tax=Streptomyces sp. NPDC058297 TaxID=3346433 RepID=UPI0036EFFF44
MTDTDWPIHPLWSLVTEIREAVDPASLGSRVVHYSIPLVDTTGTGQAEATELIKSAKLRLRGGEVLISKLNPRKSRVLIVTEDSLPIVSSTEFVGLHPSNRLDSRFLAYWLQAESTRQTLDSQVQSVTRSHQRVAPEDITHLSLRLPPIVQQRHIADFLDSETALIDKLVQLRERQLELWAERTHAFTYRHVTDPSGTPDVNQYISWLGPISKGWTAPAIGRVARFIMGTTFPHTYQGKTSGDFPFIKVGDFKSADVIGRISSAENWIDAEDARALGARIVPAGAVLYARVGAALLLNRRCITTCPSVIDDNVRAITFSHGDPRYWAGVLSLLDMGQLANPGPVPSVSESQVSPIRVPDPGAVAQQLIAERLERNLLQWDRARSLVKSQIALLAERRQALITAAVTGQFDVSTAGGRNVTDGVQ